MATKISALPAGAALAGTEQIPAVQGGSTVATTPNALKTFCGIGKFAQTIGDGTTTSFVLNHGLGTSDVQVKVYRVGTPFDEGTQPAIQHTDANHVTLVFSTAPSSNQFRAVIWG
ncbi:MAG: hypothetical protein JSR67_03610 [Proteobacteria bacterium]|nr:hypothetical protein [Pseudomonadota bacterium]